MIDPRSLGIKEGGLPDAGAARRGGFGGAVDGDAHGRVIDAGALDIGSR